MRLGAARCALGSLGSGRGRGAGGRLPGSRRADRRASAFRAPRAGDRSTPGRWKPSNILLDKDGNAHVSDFGISKDTDLNGEMLTAIGSIVGTPEYMAPEQAQSEDVDKRADIYSLGVVLYQLLSHELPYVAGNILEILIAKGQRPPRPPRMINTRIPAVLDEICLRAVQPKPDDSYSTAQQMADELFDFAGRKQREKGFLSRWLRRS